MLEEHEIGIKNRHVNLLEIDKDFFDAIALEGEEEEK